MSDSTRPGKQGPCRVCGGAHPNGKHRPVPKSGSAWWGVWAYRKVFGGSDLGTSEQAYLVATFKDPSEARNWGSRVYRNNCMVSKLRQEDREEITVVGEPTCQNEDCDFA